METKKVVIVWNGRGGELDSVTVTGTDDQLDTRVRDALVKMVSNSIVSAGDSFQVELVD